MYTLFFGFGCMRLIIKGTDLREDKCVEIMPPPPHPYLLTLPTPTPRLKSVLTEEIIHPPPPPPPLWCKLSPFKEDFR